MSVRDGSVVDDFALQAMRASSHRCDALTVLKP
jgi:hypothetical protein